VAAQAELGRVGAAHEQRAAGPHAFVHHRIGRGDRVAEQARAARRGQPRHRQDVLGRLRKPVQRSQAAAGRELRIALPGKAAQRVAILQGDDRIDARVEPVDLREAGIEHLDARDVAAMDRRGQRDGIERDDLGGGRPAGHGRLRMERPLWRSAVAAPPRRRAADAAFSAKAAPAAARSRRTSPTC
jgi:hypothetical protein